MSYDEGLEQRVWEFLEERPGVLRKKMFGGVCFLIHGNMACGIIKDDLIVRVGPEGYEAYLKLSHTRKFDLTGKAMKGWVMVLPDGYASDEELFQWLERGVRHALSLPPK